MTNKELVARIKGRIDVLTQQAKEYYDNAEPSDLWRDIYWARMDVLRELQQWIAAIEE